MIRRRSQPAGDFDYEAAGHGYAELRRPDPHIAALIQFELGAAESVINVGAGMATLTIHHWSDLRQGLRELRRVSRGPVIILTFDPPALDDLWLARYFPEVIAVDQRRYPALDELARVLGGSVSITKVPIAIDSPDGFGEAYYARPEALLDARVRRAQSGFGLADSAAVARGVRHLGRDLASGEWDRLFGHLRTQPEHIGAVRLVVAR